MTSKTIETTKNIKHQQEHLNKLKEIFLNSNYPSPLIDRCMKNTIKSINNKLIKHQQDDNKSINNNTNNNNKIKHQITVLFVHGVEVLKRKLEKLNIKVLFSYPNKIKIACTNLIEQK